MASNTDANSSSPEKAKAKKKVEPGLADKGCEFIKNNEESNLENLLSTHPKLKTIINKHDIKWGKNMLHTAVEEGRQTYVDMLVDYGAKVNFRTKDQQTAIMLAAHSKENDIIKFLIENKGDINIAGNMGDTALHIASRRGHLSTVELLVGHLKLVAEKAEKKAMERSEDSEDGNDDEEDDEEGTQKDPSVSVVESSLAESSAAVTLDGTESKTVEGSAELGNSSESIAEEKKGTGKVGEGALEVENGENGEEEEVNEETKVDVMSTELTFTHQIEMKNELAETPLANAIKMQNWLVADYLIQEAKADVNCISINGNTPLTRSAFDGRLESVKYCLKQHCDVDMRTITGESAIVICIKQRKFDIAKYLLKEGKANIEDRDSLGNTSLLFGAMTDNLQIAKFCVDVGKANIDACNNWGTTGAMFCAKKKKGESSVLKYLITKDCDLNILDRTFHTALMYACRNGNMKIAVRLLEFGSDWLPTNDVGLSCKEMIENKKNNIETFRKALRDHSGKEKESKYPLREKPAWVIQQVEEEIEERERIAEEQYIMRVLEEEGEMFKQEILQLAEEEKIANAEALEEERKKAEWEALSKEEQDKILRQRKREAAKVALAAKEEAIANGTWVDPAEVAARLAAEEIEKKTRNKTSKKKTSKK